MISTSEWCQSCREQVQQTDHALLDHLVGSGEQVGWHCYAQSLGGFQIDDQLEASAMPQKQKTAASAEHGLDVTSLGGRPGAFGSSKAYLPLVFVLASSRFRAAAARLGFVF
jgi:hypothetical protein